MLTETRIWRRLQYPDMFVAWCWTLANRPTVYKVYIEWVIVIVQWQWLIKPFFRLSINKYFIMRVATKHRSDMHINVFESWACSWSRQGHVWLQVVCDLPFPQQHGYFGVMPWWWMPTTQPSVHVSIASPSCVDERNRLVVEQGKRKCDVTWVIMVLPFCIASCSRWSCWHAQWPRITIATSRLKSSGQNSASTGSNHRVMVRMLEHWDCSDIHKTCVRTPVP